MRGSREDAGRWRRPRARVSPVFAMTSWPIGDSAVCTSACGHGNFAPRLRCRCCLKASPSADSDFMPARWVILTTRMQLLSELAGNIAFALDRFEQEARRRLAETAIIEARQQLQALSTRLIEAQEDERREIARELHDEIGQALSLVKIKLQQAGRLHGHDTEVLLEDCIGIADDTLKQVRDMSLDLRRAADDSASRGAGWTAAPGTFRRFQTAIERSAAGRLAQEIENRLFSHAHELLKTWRATPQPRWEVRLGIVGDDRAGGVPTAWDSIGGVSCAPPAGSLGWCR